MRPASPSGTGSSEAEDSKVGTGLEPSTQAVLDGLAGQICVLDDAGVIVAVNRAWRDFARASGAREDAVSEGADYLAVCERGARIQGPGAADAALCGQRLRELLAGQREAFQLEYDCDAPDHARRFLLRAARVALPHDLRVVVAHENLTALKQTQETLRRSEVLLADLTASIPGALFRLTRRDDGRWQFPYLSPGVEALFGIQARQARADATALWDCVLREDRKGFEASLEEAWAARSAWEHECRIETPAGATKWIQFKAARKGNERAEPAWTGVVTDVSERKRLEGVLRASEATYRTLFETVPQGVVYHDRQGRITAANPAAQRILGLSLDQLQGRTSIDPRWKAVREDGRDFPGEDHPAMVALRTGAPVHDVVMGIDVPGRGRAWILIDATPAVNAAGQLGQVYATFEDITQRIELSHELQRQARTDELTGLANRRSLMERLKLEFERLRRHPDRPCSILALDLDHFKRVNDTWGHAVGDALLVHVAAAMRASSRVADLVGRSGGEEFMVVLPDTSTRDALPLAERLRQRIETSVLSHDGCLLAATVSIGIGTMRADDPGIDAVLARADRALYRAKASGRNVVESQDGEA